MVWEKGTCHPPSFLQFMLEEEQEGWMTEDSTRDRENLTGPLPSTQSQEKALRCPNCSIGRSLGWMPLGLLRG